MNKKDDIEDLYSKAVVKSPDEVEYVNKQRFSTGIKGIDRVYGTTYYRYLQDHPHGFYKKGDFMHKGYQPYAMVVAKNKDEAKQSIGMPKSFLSIWGGSPGVGKSRLAIYVCKCLNRLGHKTLYFNGEAEESDFRGWLGNDVDGELFRFMSTSLIKTADSVDAIYQEKPSLVVFDSFQMIQEVEKAKDMKETLNTFKRIKGEIEANNPHIIFISQLNKKEELAGSRYIEHMVDFVASITKHTKIPNSFMFSCPRKNRNGESGNSAIFQHTDTSIIEVL